MGRGEIPLVENLNTMGWGFNIPWVEGPKYHG